MVVLLCLLQLLVVVVVSSLLSEVVSVVLGSKCMYFVKDIWRTDMDDDHIFYYWSPPYAARYKICNKLVMSFQQCLGKGL